ncbi:MAG: NAD(P)H-binding protein [Bacteroidia bacterium]
MKVVITGATGMIGKGVLLECLEDAGIEAVLLVNRNPIGMTHAKLKEVLLKDFLNPDTISNELRGYDAAFFCLGVSAGGMKEEDYHRITYDYTLNFARVFLRQNPGSQFVYVSGTGTDSSEKGRMMWARVKGRTENDLLKMPFKKAFMFRPGAIRPLRGIKSRTPLYQRIYTIMNPLWPVLEWMMGDNLTDTTRIARAMIHAVTLGSDKTHLENKEINQLAAAGI